MPKVRCATPDLLTLAGLCEVHCCRTQNEWRENRWPIGRSVDINLERLRLNDDLRLS
jgi:hypothetical protein